jgi:putative hydrolase
MKGPFFYARSLETGSIPLVDAHIHTTLTDGRSAFDEYALRAKDLGLKAIAFTEHMDDTSVWFDDYLALRERINELAAPVKVYFGAEVKACRIDGTLNLNFKRAIKLDFIIGVLHRYPDGTGSYHSFHDLSAAQAQEIDFELSRALLSNPLVDVWGHPGGVYATYFGAYREELLRELVAHAERNGKVVEINSKPRYRPVFQVIYEECLRRDCLISIGSDAHEVSELGEVCTFLDNIKHSTTTPQ